MDNYDYWKLNPPEEDPTPCGLCEKFIQCPEEVDGGEGWGYCLKWCEWYKKTYCECG